jgi:hypothetical protein
LNICADEVKVHAKINLLKNWFSKPGSGTDKKGSERE